MDICTRDIDIEKLRDIQKGRMGTAYYGYNKLSNHWYHIAGIQEFSQLNNYIKRENLGKITNNLILIKQHL